MADGMIVAGTPEKAKAKVQAARDSLDEAHKTIILQARKLVTVENLELIGKLYRALDKNENNSLDAGDFHDADPNIDTYLQQIWHTIRENFDFDGDGTISQDEFVSGFVLPAYTSQRADSRIPMGTLKQQMHLWTIKFNDEIRTNLGRFTHYLQEHDTNRALRKRTVEAELAIEAANKKKHVPFGHI